MRSIKKKLIISRKRGSAKKGWLFPAENCLFNEEKINKLITEIIKKKKQTKLQNPKHQPHNKTNKHLFLWVSY